MEQAPLPAVEELAQLDDPAGMQRNAILMNWGPRCYGGIALSYSWGAGVPMTGLHYSMGYFFEALGAK